MPVAYASWAWLDAESEARMKANIKKPAPNDWPKIRRDGEETLWLVDFVAPYGGTDEALKDLKENLLGARESKH
jgi:cytolysin-activating lysine-acyltransferase